jgi:hypothetical protein
MRARCGTGNTARAVFSIPVNPYEEQEESQSRRFVGNVVVNGYVSDEDGEIVLAFPAFQQVLFLPA